MLPDQLEDQNLVNQVIVVTDETGEDEAVRDQTSIRVENKKTSDAVPLGQNPGTQLRCGQNWQRPGSKDRG